MDVGPPRFGSVPVLVLTGANFPQVLHHGYRPGHGSAPGALGALRLYGSSRPVGPLHPPWVKSPKGYSRRVQATFLSPTGKGDFPVAQSPILPSLHRSSATKSRRSGPRRALSVAAKLNAHSVNRRGHTPIAPAIFAMGFSVQGGGIAQLEEHLLCKQGVVGSSPITSTNSMPDTIPAVPSGEPA